VEFLSRLNVQLLYLNGGGGRRRSRSVYCTWNVRSWIRRLVRSHSLKEISETSFVLQSSIAFLDIGPTAFHIDESLDVAFFVLRRQRTLTKLYSADLPSSHSLSFRTINSRPLTVRPSTVAKTAYRSRRDGNSLAMDCAIFTPYEIFAGSSRSRRRKKRSLANS